MIRFLRKTLSAPVNAVKTTVVILSDGAKEVWFKTKLAFAGGPFSELSEYYQMLKDFFGARFGRIRAQFATTKSLLSAPAETESEVDPS